MKYFFVHRIARLFQCATVLVLFSEINTFGKVGEHKTVSIAHYGEPVGESDNTLIFSTEKGFITESYDDNGICIESRLTEKESSKTHARPKRKTSKKEEIAKFDSVVTKPLIDQTYGLETPKNIKQNLPNIRHKHTANDLSKILNETAVAIEKSKVQHEKDMDEFEKGAEAAATVFTIGFLIGLLLCVTTIVCMIIGTIYLCRYLNKKTVSPKKTAKNPGAEKETTRQKTINCICCKRELYGIPGQDVQCPQCGRYNTI
ncbi:hypothetical protein EGM51_03735 [Verrucomicrobia bacterium S94]|nr:hypothetical protein EGM51_03735 [Verrucomicrobia bacterium S94]